MLKKESLFFLIVLNYSIIYSQDLDLKSHFISIHSGVFISSIEQFNKTYDSQYGFIYGLGAALAISSRSYAFVKVSYFSKAGSPVMRVFDDTFGSPVILYEKKEGTAKFTQLIFNEGFMYNFFLHHEWTLGLNAGITLHYYLKKQEMRGEIVFIIQMLQEYLVSLLGLF